MNTIDYNTLSAAYAIPKWWLEMNFDNNTPLMLPAYMKELNSLWARKSRDIRAVGWHVPDHGKIKNQFLSIGTESRPCYDCKDEVHYSDVVFAFCFPREKMPAVTVGDTFTKHFNLFILCKMCASKEYVIAMRKNPHKAVDHQHTDSTKQLLLRAEMMAEQKKLIELKEQLDKIRKEFVDCRKLEQQIAAEEKLRGPLQQELDKVTKENDKIRARLNTLTFDTTTILEKFQTCKTTGAEIANMLHQMSKKFSANTERLEEVVDTYEGEFTNEKKCGICWGSIDVYVALTPCFHVFCQKCAYTRGQCSFCSTAVTGHQVVRFP